MLRTIGCALLLAGGMFSSQSFAIQNYTLQAGPAYDYELPSKDPVVFSNIFMWSIKASCSIMSEDDDNFISFKLLRKSGTINETPLASGDEMSLVVHPSDTFYITAISGAKVELINHGDKSIVARCSAVYS